MGMLLTYHPGYRPEADQPQAEQADKPRKPRKRTEAKPAKADEQE